MTLVSIKTISRGRRVAIALDVLVSPHIWHHCQQRSEIAAWWRQQGSGQDRAGGGGSQGLPIKAPRSS